MPELDKKGLILLMKIRAMWCGYISYSPVNEESRIGIPIHSWVNLKCCREHKVISHNINAKDSAELRNV
jgi:hypothetical protein